MSIRISNALSAPIYIRMLSQIRQSILNGGIAEGDHKPLIRLFERKDL